MDGVKTVSKEELREKMDRGDDFVLLEVLSEEAYQSGHLPGAIRFADMDLVPELLPDRSTQIIAYCSNFN